MNKKIGLATLGLGLTIGVAIAGYSFIEQQKNQLLEEKIKDIELQYNKKVTLEESHYNYFTDTLTLSNVHIDNPNIDYIKKHDVDQIIFNNPRTKPDIMDMNVTGIHFPVEFVTDALKKKNVQIEKINFIKHLAKDKKYFLIDANILDTLDKKNGIISTSFDIGIQDILSIGSNVNFSQIPEGLLALKGDKNYFSNMTPEKYNELMNIKINPSNLYLETQGVFASMKDYIIRTDFKNEKSYKESLNKGINATKNNFNVPLILKDPGVTAIISLRDGNEFYISLNLEKTLTIGEIFNDMIILKTGSADDINSKLGLSITSKTL
jgi:hypothetical protein